MTVSSNLYSDYVKHPRFGRGPRITGLNPAPTDSGVQLHWNAVTHRELVAQFEAATGSPWPYGDLTVHDDGPRRIPNTAVRADLSRQTPATVPVTHYFDLERQCRDCHRPFIFFAEEQKHWYEELGFGLESDCVRCVDCRRHRQQITRQRHLYESLFHVEDRSDDQTLTLAAACLSLMEHRIFTKRQTERVRMLLNQIPGDSAVRGGSRFSELVRRLHALEADR